MFCLFWPTGFYLGSFILERNICCHSEGLKHHTITLEWKGCVKSNFRSHQHESFLFLSAKILISQLFTFHLNCKYHPWGLINDMQISIYNRKHWHAFSHSLHFVRHEGLATHPPSPTSKSGSRLPSIFTSVCLGLVSDQIDSPYVPYYNVMNYNTQGRILCSTSVIIPWTPTWAEFYYL